MVVRVVNAYRPSSFKDLKKWIQGRTLERKRARTNCCTPFIN